MEKILATHFLAKQIFIRRIFSLLKVLKWTTVHFCWIGNKIVWELVHKQDCSQYNNWDAHQSIAELSIKFSFPFNTTKL